jgi:enoyl-CoA hydratase/carnithine racemase
MNQVTWQTQSLITRLRLNRPQALNALTEEMAVDFSLAVKRIAREKSKVVILESDGPAFCAGGDLEFIEKNRKRSAATLAPLMRRFYGSFLSLRSLPQVSIARIHGSAVGAGLCLALACDLRVVMLDAQLGFNFVRLGLNPGMGAWPLARAAFGDARARELLMTGRMFTGHEMMSWSAASASAATPAELEAVADDLARTVASGSFEALRILKTETNLREDLNPLLTHEARGQSRTFKGADLAEGLAALRERRSPTFPH